MAKMPCPKCDGCGMTGTLGDPERCFYCHGTGEIDDGRGEDDHFEVELRDTDGRVIQHQPLGLSLLDGLRNNYGGRDMRAPWVIAKMLGMPDKEG